VLKFARFEISMVIKKGIFSLSHHVQTISGTLPAFCQAGTEGSFPGDKTPGA
jgi:hypothetical protein